MSVSNLDAESDKKQYFPVFMLLASKIVLHAL